MGSARPTGRLVVVVDRRLAKLAREGHRQLSARVDLAEQHVGDRVAGFGAGEPGLEDGGRAEATTFVSASGRPLNSTTTNGFPVAATASLIASRSSSCLPGRSRSRARRRPHRSARASLTEGEHDLVGRLRGGHRLGEPAVVPHISSSGFAGGFWLLGGSNQFSRLHAWVKVTCAGALGAEAGDERDRVLGLTGAAHGPSMSAGRRRTGRSGRSTWRVRAGVPASVLQQDHRLGRPRCAPPRGRRR